MSSEEDIFIAIKESAKILFGLGRLAFLVVDPDKSVLTGANFLGQSTLLQRLSIKLNPVGSLAAAAVSSERPYSTLDKDRPVAVSLVDVQISHILDAEGVLYVPMRIRDRHIGLMTYGISIMQHAKLQRHIAWMAQFAHLAAISIDARQELLSNEEKIGDDVADQFEMRARRVVHEAGNPLAIIKNYLKIVTQKIPSETNVHQEFGIISEEIDRVSDILQSLTSLNPSEPAAATVDINGIIEGMLSLYGTSLFSSCGVSIIKTLDPTLPPVSGDRDSVKQILLNIWKNAAEVMQAGGHVGITTAPAITKNGRNFVEIVLSDSGPGLPQDVQDNLFKPLEQYRRPGHSGLGLSIVATLVKNLKGHITCQSVPGLGTTFTILLPHRNGNN